LIDENASDEAKARYAGFWGQLPVLPEQRAAQLAAERAARYDSSPPKSLADYASAPRPSKWDQGDLSDVAYTHKLRPMLHHLEDQLDAEEFGRVVSQFQAADTRIAGGQTHADLRSHLDAHSGVGRGIFGMASPTDRASSLGSRFGGEQQPEKLGHLVAGATRQLNPTGTGAEHVALSFLDRLLADGPAAMPVRPAVPYGSSGDGWTVSRG
jgi:hypothetical protein